MKKSKFGGKKEWREFGIGLAIILSIIATIQFFFSKQIYFFYYRISVIVLLISLIMPIVVKPIFILFSYLGKVIGLFLTRIILIILFYLVFTSIGFIARLFGSNFLDLKLDENMESYWIDKKTKERINNYERQF